ncbi:Ger(x)C family spore germination protein [Virgibacillus proomii]|uniref:Ger(x)C family spore germination protein n=1 Tax=Virgibacillus proomii TaxID=84407 RepID=UPI00281693F9|nr:Ger(x)C family spore germination protein [Virgibacillus proomii]
MFTSACVEPKQIEQLAIINARGVDQLKQTGEELIETTLVIFQFDTQTNDITEIATGTGKTIKEARHNADSKTSFTLSPGQIRLELYGMDTAKSGINSYLNTLHRDARTTDRVMLAITDKTAKEVLTAGQEATNINVGLFINGLIKQKITNDMIPKAELNDFTHAFYEKGRDPVLPFITTDDGVHALTGVALFKGDTFVGKLSLRQALYINLILKKIKAPSFNLGVPTEPLKKYIQEELSENENEDIYLNGQILTGKDRTTLLDKEQLTFQTDITIEMNILELSKELELENKKVVEKLEEEIGNQMEKEYAKLLETTQEMGADPFGYGEIYRIHKKNGKLKKGEWYKLYPDIKVKFNANIKIVEYGDIR